MRSAFISTFILAVAGDSNHESHLESDQASLLQLQKTRLVTTPSTYTCDNFQCGNHWVTMDPSTSCGSSECTTTQCCRLTCGPYVCEANYTMGNTEHICAGVGVCTPDECCVPTCLTHKCPAHWLRHDATTCSSSVCNHPECCQQTCDTFTCPFGWNSNDDPSHECAGGVCAKEQCCTEIPERHCIRVTTGNIFANGGRMRMTVTVADQPHHIVNGFMGHINSVFSDKQKVRCFNHAISKVEFKGLSHDAWKGTIEFSQTGNGGAFHTDMCDDCSIQTSGTQQGTGDTGDIVIDGGSDSSDQAPTHCFNGNVCHITPLNA